MALRIVILAAGQGKRMRSSLPKVLHHLAGKPLLQHVIDTAFALDKTTRPIVVYGHQGDRIRHHFEHLPITWIEQKEQLGTGHALQQALPEFSSTDRVLVLYGDVPLIGKESLQKLMTATSSEHLGMRVATLPHPTGFGRIIRDHDRKVVRIVEEKDANEEEKSIHEINPGIYLIPAIFLEKWLPNLTAHNAQKEYYLTDIIRFAAEENIPSHTDTPFHYQEVLGINDRMKLAELERFYQKQYAEKLMLQGVTIIDPARIDIRGELIVGHDVTIDVNTIFEGRVVINNHCTIGPYSILRNVTLGDHVEIKAHSVIDGAEIKEHCMIGPFARLRPGTTIASHAHIGNFVEVKNSWIDAYTKINHLSYVGDSEIGKYVNIGAGVITCNYDGVNKHKTIIGDNAFIGSNTALVAPLEIGEKATIGAGSTITKNAPPEQLTVCRAQQRTIENWQRSKKTEKES